MSEGSRGTEETGYEATKGSYWRALQHRRTWGIASVVLALVVIGGAVALSATRHSPDEQQREPDRRITPAEPTVESTPTLPSYEETATGDQGVGGATPSPSTGPAPGAAPAPPDAGADATVPDRAPLVAYRREGWLCVAAEDGSAERRIAQTAGGAFSLSPDGGTLAFVDATAGVLSLADVASCQVENVGPAQQDQPSWAADSSWVAYVAPGSMVSRVGRDGLRRTSLFAGSMPTASVVGSYLVALDSAGTIVLWRDGRTTPVAAKGSVTGMACDTATLYYAAIAGDGSVSLHALGLDGRSPRVLVPMPAASRSVTIGDLLLDPSAARLAYAERSDDGYSRVFSLAVGAGAPVSLCVRRDCYPLRWSADGKSLLFIEGNALQGDPTALMRVQWDGQSRRLLVERAGR